MSQSEISSVKFNTKTFFQQKVRPHLRELAMLQRRAQLSFAGGATLGAVSLAIGSTHRPVGWVLLLAAVALFAIGYFALKDLRHLFKAVVMKNLFAALYPDFQYRPDDHIPEAVYCASRLFLHRYDRYEGDDLVVGKVGETDFSFSELHTQYKTTSRTSKGTRTQWHTLFRGIFFHADFNKKFYADTYVFPDRAEALLGKWLGQGIQSAVSTHGEIVKLENPQFEKCFVTYSSSQQEARYLLTPLLMERMLRLRASFQVDVLFAFTAGRVFVAFSTGSAHFEPRLWGGPISMKDIAEHRALIRSLIGIVEELNLNQRIWTK